MTDKQLDHYEVMNRKKEVSFTTEIVLFLDDLRIASNIAGIFRIADALQVKKIFLLVEKELIISKKFRSIARIHEKDINFEVINEENSINTIRAYAQKGYHISALEFTANSRNLPSLSSNQKHLLIAGSERHGIRKSILSEANQSVHIPMQGKISSINVMQAVGIALYEIRREELLS